MLRLLIAIATVTNDVRLPWLQRHHHLGMSLLLQGCQVSIRVVDLWLLLLLNSGMSDLSAVGRHVLLGNELVL